MKARTKAAKIKGKRGRPRHDVEREPGGRPSRRIDDVANAAREVVRNRRIREEAQRGNMIKATAADDPRRGYVIGRMLIDGTISQAEHDAALKFARLKQDYYVAAGLQFPSAQAQDLFKIRGMPAEETEAMGRRAQSLADSYMKVYGALKSIPGCHHYAAHAVNEAAFMDNEYARDWPEHMLEYLRRGLRELVFQFGLDART